MANDRLLEKPINPPKPMPNDPHHVLASWAITCLNEMPWLMNSSWMSVRWLWSRFRKNIIPRMFPRSQVFVYDFSQNRVPGAVEEEVGYWRDVGTLDAYWESRIWSVSNQNSTSITKWPVRSHTPPLPPQNLHFSDLRTGHAINAIISAGSIISGALVINSVLIQRQSS